MNFRKAAVLVLFSLMWSCSGGGDSGEGDSGGESFLSEESWVISEEVLHSFESDGYYTAYVASGVNNTPVAARDEQGHLHTILAVGTNNLRLYSQDVEGGWTWTHIPVSSPTNRIKCPSLIVDQGTFHASWIEVDDSSHQNFFVYAKANSSSPGGLNWGVKKVASFDTAGFSEELKYTAFAVPQAPAKPLIASTQGYPDIHVRIADTNDELDISPLDSGIFSLEKSSDVTLAADGNRVILMWEENDDSLGPGLSANLVFRMSNDGGATFSAPSTLYSDGTGHGGDPSVCFVGEAVYVTYQRAQIGGGGKIFVARKLPGQAHFEKFGDYGMDETGVLGSGWLPNIHGTPECLVVSWEESNNHYFDKWDHRIAVALIKDADTTPSVEFLPATDAPAADSSVYDLVAHALFSEEESCVDVFWIRVEEQGAGTFLLSLMHRKFSLSEITLGYVETEIPGDLSVGTFTLKPADIDGDGDLDLVEAANLISPTRMWMNDGEGAFTLSPQTLGTNNSHALVIADVDGDGDVDLIEGNNTQSNQVYFNNGSGSFLPSAQVLPANPTWALASADFNGDGAVDLVEGNAYVSGSKGNRILLNGGAGYFFETAQTLGNADTLSVAVADLDGDGDMDVVTGNNGSSNRVWLNDGTGSFAGSSQDFGVTKTTSVLLIDLNGDSHPDLVSGSVDTDVEIWLGIGDGTFASPLFLAEIATQLAAGDLDKDGDIDLVLGEGTDQENQIFLNDGNGGFIPDSQALGATNTRSLSLGDLNGDGFLDLIEGNFHQENRLWICTPIQQ